MMTWSAGWNTWRALQSRGVLRRNEIHPGSYVSLHIILVLSRSLLNDLPFPRLCPVPHNLRLLLLSSLLPLFWLASENDLSTVLEKISD